MTRMVEYNNMELATYSLLPYAYLYIYTIHTFCLVQLARFEAIKCLTNWFHTHIGYAIRFHIVIGQLLSFQFTQWKKNENRFVIIEFFECFSFFNWMIVAKGDAQNTPSICSIHQRIIYDINFKLLPTCLVIIIEISWIHWQI